MTKMKKKRNKRYQGQDAALAQSIVTKVQAANRNKFAQWWFDHKKITKPVIIASGVILLVIWIIVEIVRAVNNA
jgi:hypothetical protein